MTTDIMNHHSVRTSFTQIYDSGQLQMKIKSKVCFAVLVSPPRYCHPMSQVTLVLIPDQQQIKTAARYKVQFYIFRGVYLYLCGLCQGLRSINHIFKIFKDVKIN